MIPHLNTPRLLAKCLASVAAQRLDHGSAEIIVVDNGSQASIAEVQAAYPQVRWLDEPHPGPGLARNTGIRAARSATLAFIDADCTAAPGWLQAAVTAVEADPGRAVIGGDIHIDFQSPPRLTGIEAYEAVFGFRQKLYIEAKHFSVTANLAMAASVHAAVGPFGGIAIAEDLDWGRRAYAAGYPTRYCPAMLVRHPARSDFAALIRKWQRHIRHDWHEHRSKGRSGWAWRLRALAMIVSIPVEAVKFFVSPRLSGLGNRLRGIAVLARIRAFRAADMLHVMATGEDATSVWNRAP
ncbi:hypothetical protein IP88_05895 [alpha proteobacterium AAP81b]|nr:hypothetical protein IP88_05895 [alpha proteobacterium AAP81b]